MGQIDNLNDPYARTRDMKRQQRRSAHATPGNNMSIGRDGLLVYGGGSITIDNNGGITITGPDGQIIGSGTIEWTGTFTNTGQTNLNGPTAVTGDTTVTGPFHVQGATDITGDTTVVGPFHVQGATDITGNTALNGDMTVGAGGKITAGVMAVDPAAGRYGGALVSSQAIDVVAPQLYVGTTVVAHQLLVADAATELYGTVKFFGTATTTSASNVYWDPTTKLLSRVSSARRFKIRPRKMKVAPELLNVPVKEWIDRGARKRGEPDVYVPGVIAEEVNAAGGGQFVTHGPDGELEGVAYDRLALARTQLLNDKLERALARIDELERRLAV